MVSIRHAGTPQGSPLSLLLSNILLDDFDKELERRGHCFCRYADDVNVYVRSRRAGERVMESLTRFLEGRMRLKVNRTKSAVDRPWKRTFLGYTVTTHFSPRLKPAPASLTRAKDRIRHITHAGRGRNIRTVIDEVNRFTRGWVGYFRLATVTDPFDKLDQWIRRRLRKILWEQWKKPKTRCRKMVALGTRGCACAQGHRHRARRLVERGGLAHACGREQSLACGVGTPEPSDSTPGSAAEHLNRRVRNRTHGGVGGREG